MSSSSERRRIFVYSIPRSRSHLLMRLLGTHPALATSHYPLEVAYSLYPASPVRQVDIDGIKTLWNVSDPNAEEWTYQGQIDALQTLIAEMEREGKIPVIKEHTYALHAGGYKYRTPVVDRMLDITNGLSNTETITTTLNPTLFSDRFFHTLSPIILIRHPARVFPSFFKAEKTLGHDILGSDAEYKKLFRSQRELFESWCRTSREPHEDSEANERTWPVVLDGDRLVADTEALMTKLCERIRIDSTLIQYTWAPGHNLPVPHLTDVGNDAFLGEIRSSSGVKVNPDVFKVPNMEEETSKWAAEWGEDTAEKLKSSVEAVMEDYEYLLEFHL